MAESNPEIGKSIVAGGYETNYHDIGSGETVVFVHGSGPGVSSWANWRLTIPDVSQELRVIALDMIGFGYSARPAGDPYSMENWVKQLIGLLDALGIEKTHLVGNSFGAALSLQVAIRQPERVNRLVLMGAMGVHAPLPAGLDAVWGYEPSRENMRTLVNLFAYNKAFATDDLIEMRYNASVRPGFQESFHAMFPEPRQRWVDAMASEDADLQALPHETLIIHGREDPVIPLANGLRLTELIPNAQLHVFGHCGHWTQIEHAKRFNKLVADFLTE